MKYHVVITYEVWNGEQTIEHEYDSASQAAAVYERVCRIWEHVFEGNEDANYTIELY